MPRKDIDLTKPYPRVKGPPIEGDWRRLEGLLHDGIEPSKAAASFGRTLTDFRKQDYFRHQRLLALSREARADRADRTLDEWANAEGASDTIRVYWHRYTANAAGRGIERHQVELSAGPSAHLEDRSASLDDIARVLESSGALAAGRSGGDGDGGGASGEPLAEPGEPLAAPADGEREAGGVPLP